MGSFGGGSEVMLGWCGVVLGRYGVLWGWCGSGVGVVYELGWVGVVVVWGGVGRHHGGHCAVTGRGRAGTSLIHYAR